MLRKLTLIVICLLAACDTLAPSPTPTPPVIVKVLATAYISPTPNPEEEAATRAASSPTPLPPTLTVIPTETPYIGIFIGEAQPGLSFVQFSEPLFAGSLPSEPTANAEVCAIPIDNLYLPAWRNNAAVHQRLGCPIQASFGFFGQVQLFERGVMYIHPELNAIWSIVPQRDELSSSVQARGHYDYLENPPENSTIGIQPPNGLLVPGDIFGNMWLAVDGLRDELGFARTEAQEIGIGIQRFENGTFLLDGVSGQVYALVTDGSMLGPFLAPQTSLEGATPTPTTTITPTPE